MPARAATDPNAGREWSILRGGPRDRRVHFSDELDREALRNPDYPYRRTQDFVSVEKIYSYVPVKERAAIEGQSARIWTYVDPWDLG